MSGPGTTQTDAESAAICAIRYCIGRQSYIVSDGCRWAREWGAKSQWVRSVIIHDLENATHLGAASDERDWRAVLADLKAMS